MSTYTDAAWPRWYMEFNSSFHRCQPWEEAAFNNAVDQNLSVITYLWTFNAVEINAGETPVTPQNSVEYEVDLLEMVQINKSTGYKRHLICFQSPEWFEAASPLRR